MSKNESGDHSINNEETPNAGDSKISQSDSVKKEVSSWTEVKKILNKNDINNLNDGVKNEETDAKSEVKAEVANSTEQPVDDKNSNKPEKLIDPKVETNSTDQSDQLVAKKSEISVENSEKKIGETSEAKVVEKIEKISPTVKEKSVESEEKNSGKIEEVETIQLIEETIVIPTVPNSEAEKPVETIEYNVIEYTNIESKSLPASNPKSPANAQNDSKNVENSSHSPQATTNSVPSKSRSAEAKKRSVIEDIFDDWKDENTEEEDTASSKADDAVEHQLKSLLDEKTSKPSEAQKPTILSKPPKNSADIATSEKVSLVEIIAEKMSNKKEEEKKPAKADHESADSKELLAILEGDVEPDWSDLKPPPLLVQQNKDEDIKTAVEHNNPPKLDPLIERQLALKQLLELPVSTKKPRISPRKSPVVPKRIFDEDEAIEEIKFDETRSGRKRKPTEKAREHEISAKRQKIIKMKITGPKTTSKKSAEPPVVEIPKEPPSDPKQEAPADESSRKIVKEKKSVGPGKKMVRKVQPKTPNAVKSSPKKSPKSPTASNTEGAVKPRKKAVNEIDRLLQDEGVVNLLYDVEQPGKRRLVPVTKSQVKVMDIVKVQRELKIRTKLVKNAVLRLRTSATPSAKVPRPKRSSAGSFSTDDSLEPASKTPKSSSGEFLFPAKIRNAADASVIVRRHSSSSFSSASGSPRVSIDSTDKQSGNLDDVKGQGYVKAGKRSYSQDEKKKAPDAKKSKKNIDHKINENILPKSKGRPSLPAKGKNLENKKSKSRDSADESDETLSNKLATLRSNGAAGRFGREKRNQKNKVTFAKHAETSEKEEEDEEDDDESETDEPNEPQEIDDEQDELSACLAEAVTALANDSANRGKNAVLSRKAKYRGDHRGKDGGKIQFNNKEINVQRHGNLVQLILTPSTTSKIRNGITLQMMQEFKEILSILKKDDDCRVVLLTSTGSSFCEGLELSTLLNENKDIRRANAQLLASGVKDFIKSLATFNKPIVAGVQGSAVGLGVTMLPLFDLVIASDKASFSTPYGKLGQIAEGAAIFTLSHVLGSAVTSELLLGGRTLTANEALRAGLVTRVLWPDRFHVELLPSLRAMSEQSSQSMEATKALLRHSLRTKLDAALESESYLLVQHWCSTECQNAIRAYMEEKVQ